MAQYGIVDVNMKNGQSVKALAVGNNAAWICPNCRKVMLISTYGQDENSEDCYGCPRINITRYKIFADKTQQPAIDHVEEV